MDSPPKSSNKDRVLFSASGNGRGEASDSAPQLAPAAPAPGPSSAPAPMPRLVLWTQRMFLVIFVVFAIELGMLLAVLPWTEVWTKNQLLVSYPGLRAFLNLSFVRGLVSGVGLIDIWIGVAEAVNYRERPRL